MVWSPGVQLQTSLVGTERVVIDNGAAVLTETTTAAIAALADSEPQKQNNALTTVGAGSLTAALLLGQLVVRSGPTAAFTDTTDTAANIIAAILTAAPSAAIGFSFDAYIVNNTGNANTTGYAQTIAAGTGVTLSGVTAIAPNCVGLYRVIWSGAGGVTIYGVSVDDRGINNFTATTDPGSGNDNTQGYGPGSEWINTTLSREWTCISAGTGAAVWSLGGVVPGVGYEPSSMITQFGSSTATFPEEGNINRQISSAGVSPGATTADNVVAVYSMPANAFDVLGRGVQITAAGSFAANGNSKTIKIIYNATTAVVGSTVTGGTAIATTGAVTTSGGGWQLSANVFKYGANGSNTQIAIHSQSQVGAAVSGLTAPALVTATENGAILIAITANCATATSDVVFNWLEINAMN